MALTLKKKSQVTIWFMILIFAMTIIFTASKNLHSEDTQVKTQMVNINENRSGNTTQITSKIFTSSNMQPNERHLQTVTPTTILRGNSFTVTGRLVDNETGEGFPNEQILIFWEYFSWDAYQNDRMNLIANYQIGSGVTDSLGYFTISCIDGSYSKKIGYVDVFSVFPGNPLLGPIQLNRQFTSEPVECYAKTRLLMEPNQNLLRVNQSFYALSRLIFDNDTVISESNGETMNYSWLGVEYSDVIVDFISNKTFTVESGTMIGQYPLKAYFNISIFGFPYIVGDISSHSQIGTAAAQWANRTRNINVFDGAGITFSINDPIPPGPGIGPNVVRGETNITISGLITNSAGLPFGHTVDLGVYAYITNTTSPAYRQTTTTANDLGEFNVTFILIGTYLSVGENIVWFDSLTDGIIASSETKEIIIYGNSTVGSVNVNGTLATSIAFGVMPNESLSINGFARDFYNSEPISNITVTAQWEDIGLLYQMDTTITGSFSFDLLVPSTLGFNIQNGTIYIKIETATYFTAFEYNFTVNVFSSVLIRAFLNDTEIVENTLISNLNGLPLRTNRSFTLTCLFYDQFNRSIDRPLNNRVIQIDFEGLFTLGITLTDGQVVYVYTDSLANTGTNYPIRITFKEGIEFNFQIRFVAYPTTPTPTPTNTTTPPGGFDMGYILIGILVALTAGILIISVVYAFGRFRRSKLRSSLTYGKGSLDLQTILKQIDESEKAKDYKRATILCYNAFEIICNTDFGIQDAHMQSPRELARIVAQTNRLPVRDVTLLVMRYEEARYSDHTISKETFQQTRQALANIQIALEKGIA